MRAWLILYCGVATVSIGSAFSFCHRFRQDPFVTSQAAIFSSSSPRTASRLYESTKKNEDANENPESSTPDGEVDPTAKEKEEKERKKENIGKAAAQMIKRSVDNEESRSVFDLNPFRAGRNLRKSFDSAFSSLARASNTQEDRQNSLYYLDERFQESGGVFTQENNPYLARLQEEKYIPEVLVVGATGEVGRLVVRRLLLEGRSRVRVLVRDLYSKTLNLLGTGVVYCQGDLNNMNSLEYALTDVDKIVVCAAPPRPDEEGFKEKFLGFAKDNLVGNESVLGEKGQMLEAETETDMEWERLESVMEVRAQLAEQVDFKGMQNLVTAFQNIRFADYGTSQAAKRSLFKFQNRPEDFNLFAIDDTENEDVPSSKTSVAGDEKEKRPKQSLAYSAADDPSTYDAYAAEYDKYADDFDSYDDEYRLDTTSADLIENRQDSSVKTQVQWIRNEFGHGAFVGKVPKATTAGVGGEASVISSRLRSRDAGPEDGIDLGGGFGGFVCRVCSDGGNYEAFIRTAAYDENGIEYVCDFSTASKTPRRGNASRNKFTTVRLSFESFKPVRSRTPLGDSSNRPIPPFRGKDVRHIGFRFRSSSNSGAIRSKSKDTEMNSFYLGLSYIKLYRIQPEPEIVFLSDARIPPVIVDSQVKHDIRQLVTAENLSSSDGGGVQILNEKALRQISSDKTARSPEETYFKYRGEEVLKNSGLSYSIVRVSGYNESPSSDASTIGLKSTDDDLRECSRREVAEVCVSALLDPAALNKSFYVSKKDEKSSSSIDESMSNKFQSLPTDKR